MCLDTGPRGIQWCRHSTRFRLNAVVGQSHVDCSTFRTRKLEVGAVRGWIVIRRSAKRMVGLAGMVQRLTNSVVGYEFRCPICGLMSAFRILVSAIRVIAAGRPRIPFQCRFGAGPQPGGLGGASGVRLAAFRAGPRLSPGPVQPVAGQEAEQPSAHDGYRAHNVPHERPPRFPREPGIRSSAPVTEARCPAPGGPMRVSSVSTSASGFAERLRVRSCAQQVTSWLRAR